jgi:hypothetical protein
MDTGTAIERQSTTHDLKRLELERCILSDLGAKDKTLYLRGTPEGKRVFETEHVVKKESEDKE